jgi:hypothetical protein
VGRWPTGVPAVQRLARARRRPDQRRASCCGCLVETVGGYVVTALEAVGGDALDDDACESPDLAAPVPSAFVAGYRSVRPFTAEELGWLPLLVRVAAWEDWCGLQAHVREPADRRWPEWALALDTRVPRPRQPARGSVAALTSTAAPSVAGRSVAAWCSGS